MISPYPTDEEMAQFRALAEEGMLDACIVEYATGKKVTDSNGDDVDEYLTRFASKCKIQANALADSDVHIGGRREVTDSIQVHLPADSPEAFTNDRITITAIGPRTPAKMLGRQFYVGADQGKSYGTATRLNVRDKP